MAYSLVPVPTLIEHPCAPNDWMCALANVLLVSPVNPVAVKVRVAVWPTVSPFEIGGGSGVAQTTSCRLQLVWGSMAQVPEPVTPVPVNTPVDEAMPKSVSTPPPFELV